MGPAIDIATQVRTGRLRATDVVARTLEVAERSHGDLNAFTLIDTSGAMRRAEAVDALVDAGRDPGPLAGVPVALKDIIDDAGMPNSRGSSFPPPFATSSATVVRRLGRAGAVVVGRTNLHEFAFGFTSENPWFGPVRNPWDPSTSPGGSSGGSGAVVASGVVPIGIGTDTGGSIRVPAALCGIFGLKVTHGRVSLAGVFPLAASLDTVGPLARSVDDLTAAYLALAGDDPEDPWSQPVDVDPARTVDPDGLRIGVVEQWLAPPMSQAVADGFDAFLARCGESGATVTRIDAPALAPIPAIPRAMGPEIVALHGDALAEHPERFGEDVAGRIEARRDATGLDVVAAERWGSGARAEVARLVGTHDRGVDVLVCPTVGAMRKEIGVDAVEVIGGTVPHREALAAFTSPVNRMRVPAVAGPVAGTGEPPVSVQLIGPMWSEATLLGIAAALASAGVLEAREPPIFLA